MISIHGIAKPCICSSIMFHHVPSCSIMFHHVPSCSILPPASLKYPFLLNIIQYILISGRKILVSMRIHMHPSDPQCPVPSFASCFSSTDRWKNSTEALRSSVITFLGHPQVTRRISVDSSYLATCHSSITRMDAICICQIQFWNWMQWTQLLHLHVPWMLVSSSWWW